MSNIAFLFLPLAFSSLPAVLPFVSPSSQVVDGEFSIDEPVEWTGGKKFPMDGWKMFLPTGDG